MKLRRAIGAGAAMALASAAVLVPTTDAFAAPAVNVNPATNANPSGQTFAISGSGFSATANGGLGVYVAFGPNPIYNPSDWFNNISHYQTAVWVHPGGTGTNTNKNMNANGTFSFTMVKADGSPLTAQYGSTDCQAIQCGIVTMAAHGSTDRSQDSFTAVSFSSTANANPLTARVGQAQSTQVPGMTGVAPYTWSVAGGVLPPGLSLNASNGRITGTPTTEGKFKPKVQVTDSSSPKPAKVKHKVEFLVAPANLRITQTSVPAAQAGAAYAATLTGAGGIAPYKFKVTAGSPPAKIKLNGKGELKGKASAPGNSTFTVTVRDKFKFTATRTYMLTVN
jgi:hypothetical protein